MQTLGREENIRALIQRHPAVILQFGTATCAPCTAIRDAFRVSVPDTAAATKLILQYPEIFRDYEITKGRMDDVFLAVTGKKLAGGAEK